MRFPSVGETSENITVCYILTTHSIEIIYNVSDVEKCQEHVRFYTESQQNHCFSTLQHQKVLISRCAGLRGLY